MSYSSISLAMISLFPSLIDGDFLGLPIFLFLPVLSSYYTIILHFFGIYRKFCTGSQNRLKAFTLRFDRSEYFDRAHVRGLSFLVWDAVVLGAYYTLSDFVRRSVPIITLYHRKNSAPHKEVRRRKIFL